MSERRVRLYATQADFDDDRLSSEASGWRVESTVTTPNGLQVVYRKRSSEWAVPAVVLIVILAVAVVGFLLYGSGGGGTAAAPSNPRGTIVFGDSFDPKTLVVSGARTTARVGQSTVYVAYLSRTVTESQVVVAYQVPELGTFGPVPVTVENPPFDLFGQTIPGMLLMRPGTLRVTVTDAGNNVLAEGNLTVTA